MMHDPDSHRDASGEFTLLCERCGYVVAGLPRDGPCPECGTPIAASLPDRRAGSAWQRRPGLVTWVRTNLRMLRRPAGAWRDISMVHASRGLAQVNEWTAAVLIAVVAARRLGRTSTGGLLSDTPWIVVSLVLLVVVSTLLMALTRIEHAGVRFFGARRGWRVTRTIADAVCAHASVGWLVAGVLFGAGAIFVDSGLARQLAAAVGRPIRTPTPWMRYLPPGLGFLGGMLVFELLVYFGVRHNRYANRARPRPDAPVV